MEDDIHEIYQFLVLFTCVCVKGLFCHFQLVLAGA